MAQRERERERERARERESVCEREAHVGFPHLHKNVWAVRVQVVAVSHPPKPFLLPLVRWSL